MGTASNTWHALARSPPIFAVCCCLVIFVQSSSAISCYNFTSMDGKFSPTFTVGGCLACMRYTTIYNTPTIKYTMFQWACSLQPSTGMSSPQSSGTPQCIASTTVVTYSDRSLYNKGCTCCTNLCNLEDFCEPTPHDNGDPKDGGCSDGASFHYPSLTPVPLIAATIISAFIARTISQSTSSSNS